MAGVVHIPWYATLFRGDRFEGALEEIAPLALRYGATEYAIYRSRDDAYKFLQLATFEEQDRLRALLVRRGVLALARRLLGLLHGAGAVRVARPGGARRGTIRFLSLGTRCRNACRAVEFICSSGAMVSPESFSSSQ